MKDQTHGYLNMIAGDKICDFCLGASKMEDDIQIPGMVSEDHEKVIFTVNDIKQTTTIRLYAPYFDFSAPFREEAENF